MNTYLAQEKLLSQNFLHDQGLVHKLVENSSISPTDLVVEIGPGRGIITQELALKAAKVVAIEADEKLSSRLTAKYPQVKVVHGNFLDFLLPIEPYKVFANPPFRITGDIIRRLLLSPSPPGDIYLVMQSEAANKFIPSPKKNTMAAVLYYPWWDITIAHRFERTDFIPKPKVDCVLLRIQARLKSLVNNKNAYQDFVAYKFIHERNAKYILPLQWIKSFDLKGSSVFRGQFSKLLQEQGRLSKIHRTRTDKNWRSFK